MTDRQSNYLDMFLVVRTFRNGNAAVIDAVPARAAAFGLHSTNITAINAIASAQSGNISGVAADKAALRNALDTLAFEHFTAALAWARTQSNNTLAAEFDYTQSDIEKVKDDSIIPFCQHRYQIINDNSAALADYGILPATLTAWETAMTAYEPLVPGPRSARVSKKVLTAQLKTLFKQTNDHLRDIIDPLMLALRSSQPALYLGYQSSRIIIDRRGPGNGDNPTPPPPPPPPPASKFIVTGTVTDMMSGNPIEGATVTLSAIDLEVTDMTGPDGSYEVGVEDVSAPMAGNITASADGYTPQSRGVNIGPDVLATENFSLDILPPPPPPPGP